MRGIRVAISFLAVAMMGIMGLSGIAQAGTVIGGDYVEVGITLAPQEFRYFSANFDQGTEVAYAVEGDTFDLFILNEAQFQVYNSTGHVTSGWQGPAQVYIGSVQEGAWTFKAQTADTYYLVIDNTVAGANSGPVEKRTTVGVIFPYSVEETSDLPGLSLILLAVVFIGAAAVVSYLIGKRRGSG